MAVTTSTKAGAAVVIVAVFAVIFSFFAGIAGSFIGTVLFSKYRETGSIFDQVQVVEEESAIIDVASAAGPSVVSIIVTKDLPIYENFYYDPFSDIPYRRQQSGTETQQVGAGTGFVISEGGMIITNKHVVSDTDAHYTVVFPDGKKYDASVIARDAILDIAVIDIEPDEPLTPLPIGDSDSLQIGQRVIAIGNSLGRFSNTVSLGIVSGLSRNIIASDGGRGASRLDDVIQTDASINSGNSGGPLLDIRGNVIGVNVAVAQNAENIGFSIPINAVKTIIDSVNEFGEIIRPHLGVRYVPVTPALQEEEGLPVNYGALVIAGSQGESAVLPDSPAAKIGLQENDIITEINGVRLEGNASLQSEIQKYKVGEEISISYIREGETREARVELEKRPN